MEITAEYIYQGIINYHKDCSVDKWGQVGKFTVAGVFPSKENDLIKEFIKAKKAPKVSLDCYGGRLGTYYAFNILDMELNRLCSLALKENPNYRYAMTH